MHATDAGAVARSPSSTSSNSHGNDANCAYAASTPVAVARRSYSGFHSAIETDAAIATEKKIVRFDTAHSPPSGSRSPSGHLRRVSLDDKLLFSARSQRIGTDSAPVSSCSGSTTSSFANDRGTFQNRESDSNADILDHRRYSTGGTPGRPSRDYWREALHRVRVASLPVALLGRKSQQELNDRRQYQFMLDSTAPHMTSALHAPFHVFLRDEYDRKTVPVILGAIQVNYYDCLRSDYFKGASGVVAGRCAACVLHSPALRTADLVCHPSVEGAN
jgi:hypothetical protein